MSSPESKCARPVQLRRDVIDLRTGEFSSSQVQTPCGTRLADRCPHCSAIYQRDGLTILQAGVNSSDGRQRPVTFLTLTAPGADVFGPIHQRTIRQRPRGPVVEKCRCGSKHGEEDQVVGTPLDPSTYRYDRAASFNAASSRLLAVTMQKLGRIMGRKIKWVRVAEFQRRGLIHFHVLVEGVVTDAAFHAVVRGGTNLRTRRRIAPASHDGWTWGHQCDIKRVLPGSRRQVGFYMVKMLRYAVKATGHSADKCTPHGARMASASLRTCSCDHGPDCRAGSRMIPGTTAVYQGQSSSWLCRRHSLARNGWGYRGHVFSVSRRWGMTFKEVRERRRSFCAAGDVPPPPHILVKWMVLPSHSPPR